MGDPVREDELFQRAQRDKILLETNASRAATINYMAGVGGGVAVVLFGHPFDTTKTRMQTAPPGYYKNTWDAVKQTVKFEGIRGFYTGMMSPMYGQMFFRAISFMTFYSSLRAISTLSSEDVDDVPSVRSTILAGAVTGLAISAVEAPIDVVKTKLQIQIFRTRLQPAKIPVYTDVSGCIKHILSKHGSRALWQGWSATIIRNVPANALFFPVNELLKLYMAQQANIPVSELPMRQKLLAGACAGLSYWTLTYPLDAVKARIMATAYARRVPYLQVVKKMQVGDFFVGIVPCAMRGAVACSAMFYTVDVLRSYLNQHV